MVEFEVKGLEELQQDLKSLAAKMAPKQLQPILAGEARKFAAKLGPRTPVGPTGNLRRGVRSWTPRITARRPDAMARAGVRYQIAPHAHIVEYGTRERYTRAGAYRGSMPAQPFIMPLANQEMPGMLQRIINRIYEVINKEWR